jgi:hypothetical protein
MKTISAINISNANVCPHLVDYQLNKFKVAMIRCEVKGCKLLVCVRVDPALHAYIVKASTDTLASLFQGVAVKGLEALCVVFERGQRQRSEISLLLERHDIYITTFFLQEHLQLFEFVVVNALKNYLGLRAHKLRDRARQH